MPKTMGDEGASASGGGLDALLKAAKFVEEQEKQKQRRQSAIVKTSDDLEAVLIPVSIGPNGFQPFIRRLPTPPLPRHGSVIREVHNKLEKNRRAHLKECFETLRKQLPPADERKTSNLSILHNAIRYIAVLKRKEREFEHEMERLAREKIAHQQKLSTLKKELTAQWEHIDLNTLLPEVIEPEPRRASDLVNGRMAETGSDEDVVRTSTLYSSTSSMSSASPLHSQSDSVAQHTQVINSPGPPSTSLLVNPIQQLLPSTTIRMLPADTHFVHSQIPTTGITIQNGVLNHSTVTLASKHPASTGEQVEPKQILLQSYRGKYNIYYQAKKIKEMQELEEAKRAAQSAIPTTTDSPSDRASTTTNKPCQALTRELMLEAQDLFRTANKVTRPEKALILGFMAGMRENPCPRLGPIVTIKLSENQEDVRQPDGTYLTMLVETHFQMNYNTGEWKRVHKYRELEDTQLVVNSATKVQTTTQTLPAVQDVQVYIKNVPITTKRPLSFLLVIE